MNEKINDSLFLLRMSSFITVIGTGICWTGLGYYLATVLSEPRFMGVMQSCSVISGLIGPFIANYLNKNYGSRNSLILTDVFCACLCLIIFSATLFLIHYNIYIFFTIILVSVFVNQLFGAIHSIFLEPSYNKMVEIQKSSIDVQNEIANIASYSIMGKIVGMSLGPLIFAYLGFWALFLNAITFLISAKLLQTSIRNNLFDINVEKVSFATHKYFTYHLISSPPLLETSIVNSLTLIVVLVLNTRLMILNASATSLSVYWFGATICAFISHKLISISSARVQSNLRYIENKIGFLYFVPVLLGMFSEDIFTIIFCQFCFSLFNPIASNASRARFYHQFGKNNEDTIRAYALRSLLTNILILIFSILITLSYIYYINSINIFAIPILILTRWFISKSINHSIIYAEV
jgi:hypothetical protein